VSLLVLVVGTVTTDAYYGTFSVSYQYLSLPVSHFILRGITAMISNPFLLAPYAVAIAWLFLDDVLTAIGGQSYLRIRNRLGNVIVIAVLVIAIPLARQAGQRAAERDLGPRSLLPQIVLLDAGDTRLTFADGYRLLLTSGGFVICFKPTAGDHRRVLPNITRFPESSITCLETLPRATR
jgi:hypothetical protein